MHSAISLQHAVVNHSRSQVDVGLMLYGTNKSYTLLELLRKMLYVLLAYTSN